METQELGREKVGAYDCLKRVVAISSKDGESQAFVVWSATKLRGFPVKIQRRSGGPALVFTFSDIRFERPADSLFTPPSEGYHRYENLLAMTDEMTRRVWNVISRPNPSIAYPQTRPPAAGPGTGY